MSTSIDTNKSSTDTNKSNIVYHHPTWLYILLGILITVVILYYIILTMNAVTIPHQLLRRIDRVLSVLPHMGVRAN